METPAAGDSGTEQASFSERLQTLHIEISERYPFVDRIAVALYDAKTDLLKTFAHSSRGPSPLNAYQAKLGDTPSLLEPARTRRRRVSNDLAAVHGPRAEHTRRIVEHGYRSSYTSPIFVDGELLGFLFFDARIENAFAPESLPYLDLFGQIISLVIVNELTALHTLVGTVQVARSFTKLRDIETGAHLDRMSRYARIIAVDMAPTHDLSDEFIEHVFMFAPLHDIGKIGIPDAILLKPGRLTAEEDVVMRSHVEKGVEIIERMIADFGLHALKHLDILRNIVRYHHESVDGRGYPRGLAGSEIPLETRIIIVADVFDALTSRRPYKPAWSNDDSFVHMRSMVGHRLDAECFAALEKHRAEVEEIQHLFEEIRIP